MRRLQAKMKSYIIKLPITASVVAVPLSDCSGCLTVSEPASIVAASHQTALIVWR